MIKEYKMTNQDLLLENQPRKQPHRIPAAFREEKNISSKYTDKKEMSTEFLYKCTSWGD